MSSDNKKEAEKKKKKKEKEEKNDHEPSKCSKCKKKCQIKSIECDQSGLIFHCYCFKCFVCGALLNELNARIRGEDHRLFCASHALYEKGIQPICKISTMMGVVRVTF